MIAVTRGADRLPGVSRWLRMRRVYSLSRSGQDLGGPDIIAPADDRSWHPEPARRDSAMEICFFLFRIETFPDPNDERQVHSTRPAASAW